MKPGDRVVIVGPHVEATVHKVGKKNAHVWWPCPEYGLHERIVELEHLEVLPTPGHGQMPKRLKDHGDGPRHNIQRVFKDLKDPEPEPPIPEVE